MKIGRGCWLRRKVRMCYIEEEHVLIDQSKHDDTCSFGDRTSHRILFVVTSAYRRYIRRYNSADCAMKSTTGKLIVIIPVNAALVRQCPSARRSRSKSKFTMQKWLLLYFVNNSHGYLSRLCTLHHVCQTLSSLGLLCARDIEWHTVLQLVSRKC